MKIATFNINDVNKRLGNLIGWLRTEKPDVVALQELKAADREFPKAAIEKAGYGAVWRGQKTWNGVAILARGCEPIVTRRQLPGDVVIAGCDVVEDHLDEISRCAGFLMMDGGDALYDFDFLGRRQSPSSSRASVGWHLIPRL